VNSIAEASVTGHGTNVIQGLAVSLESTALPAIVIIVGIIVTYNLAGLFGIAFAVTTMLALAGMIVALDAFGPVTDNAGGIAEMAGLPKEVRHNTDALDAVGNTTKAVTKGYAIGSAGLGALVLFAAYTQDLIYFSANAPGVDLLRPGHAQLLAGRPLRRRRPAVRRPAAVPLRRHVDDRRGPRRQAVVVEVRRQFKENPGIMEGTSKPDYAKAVDLLTKAAIKEMIVPSLLPVLSPIVVFFVIYWIAGPAPASRPRRHADGRDRHRPVRRHLDDGRRRRLGQRQEVLRGRLHRQPRREAPQGLGRPQGLRHRRHRRRPLQGHGRPGREPDDQDHQHRGAAAAGGAGYPDKVRTFSCECKCRCRKLRQTGSERCLPFGG
jgi:hypothetical protein